MARAISLPEQDYAPQTRQFKLDSFLAGVSFIMMEFTRDNWPLTPKDTVLRLKVEWGNGDSSGCGIGGGSPLHPRTGMPELVWRGVFLVPKEYDPQNPVRGRKKNVVEGNITVELLQPIRTAITAEAF